MAKIPPAPRIAVVPIDAELAELTAGGGLELRSDWTATAAGNLAAAAAAESGFAAATLDAGSLEARDELEEIRALVRTFTVHRVTTALVGNADPFVAGNKVLSYQTGALPQLAAAAQADAVLFIFVRDSFATAGRKSLLALSVVGAALTGVAIVPQMGSTVMSAALVHRDGTVLWFNHSAGGHDPRTPEGARALIKDLLKGMPGRGPAAPAS